MKLVLGFAVPLLFGYVFQQMYNFVDTAIVGRTLGSAALAAVGSTGSLNFLILGFCNGICAGFGIPIAQSFGAKDEVEVRRYVTNSVWLAGYQRGHGCHYGYRYTHHAGVDEYPGGHS